MHSFLFKTLSSILATSFSLSHCFLLVVLSFPVIHHILQNSMFSSFLPVYLFLPFKICLSLFSFWLPFPVFSFPFLWLCVFIFFLHSFFCCIFFYCSIMHMFILSLSLSSLNVFLPYFLTCFPLLSSSIFLLYIPLSLQLSCIWRCFCFLEGKNVSYKYLCLLNKVAGELALLL